MTALSPTIQFDRVSFQVDDALILNGLDLEVMEGEVVVLLGESGCGKTTTLKLINKLLEPTAGDVVVEGRSVSDWNAIDLRRRIGYVLQDAGLFPHFTVEQNVGLVPRLLGWEKERTRKRLREMLELVGLPS